MTPIPTPQEVAKMQQDCLIAWDKAKTAEGLEKMRLINQAFPYAVDGGSAISGLRFKWHVTECKWVASDAAGFITLIERYDIATMLIAIGMEAARAGAFREAIEGKKPEELPLPRSVFDEPKPKKPAKHKLTIADLGLEKDDV